MTDKPNKILEIAQKKLRDDWVSHLGNYMTSDTRDMHLQQLSDMLNKPDSPISYILAAVVEYVEKNNDTE